MKKEQAKKYRENYKKRNEQKIKKRRREYNKRYYARTRKYGYSKWTDEMDKKVLEHKITDTELSKIIKKSVMSIQVRRWKLRKYG